MNTLTIILAILVFWVASFAVAIYLASVANKKGAVHLDSVDEFGVTFLAIFFPHFVAAYFVAKFMADRF